MFTDPLFVGALAPLSPPGWVDAGRHLLAGLELGTRHCNERGGVRGRPVELLVRDTAADPSRAAAAVDDLARLGVAAVVGEYHSVVARSVAARASALGVPFLCSSAVIDALTDTPTGWVARIAAVQSRGWSTYADHLLDRGHTCVAIAAQSGAYWSAGTRIIDGRMTSRGGQVVSLDMDNLSSEAAIEALAEANATAVLLLMGHAPGTWNLVRAIRRHPRLGDLEIGAPAGQPELASWRAELGVLGDSIPFLRYLPDELPAHGERVMAQLQAELGQSPSFVALEGYDTITVLAALLDQSGGPQDGAEPDWRSIDVAGTRGRIRLTRAVDTGVWQWASAPVQVAERDPAEGFRVLRG